MHPGAWAMSLAASFRSGPDRFIAALALVSKALARLLTPPAWRFAASLLHVSASGSQYGNNNLPDSSNMCHESTSVALPQTIGVPVGTVKIEDFEHTDCVMFFGQNVGVNSPRMLHQLQEVRERSVPIITFNPLRERGLTRTGILAVRGHSNVQGQRTVGITEKPELVPLDRLAEQYGFNLPRERGIDTVGTCEAVRDGSVKAFISLGGNFIRAIPDTDIMERAWRQLEMTVQIVTKLNRGALIHGRAAYLLPCLGRIEIDRQASGVQFLY